MPYKIFDKINSSSASSLSIVQEQVPQTTPAEIESLIKERKALSLSIQTKLNAYEAEFLQNSLLNDAYFKTYKEILVNLYEQKYFKPSHALALTNLSFSATGTGYEGIQLKTICQLYLTTLTIANDRGVFSADIKDKQQFIPSILSSLHQIEDQSALTCLFGSVEHNNLAEKHKNSVQQLKIGESFCMSGGWYGNPSHSMIYRFERTSNMTFKIYIYDAQGGPNSFRGGQATIERDKPHPYVLLDQVSWEELFFASNPIDKGEATLFKHLIGLIIPEKSKKNLTIEAVLHCFSYLSHRRVPSNELPQLFISHQRSGNCSVKTTNCLILDLVSKNIDLKTTVSRYKKLSLDVRLLNITAFYEYFKKNDLVDPEKRDRGLVQLREACRNFLRIVEANFNRPQIGISEVAYTRACATIYHILQELNEMRKDLAAQSTSAPYLLGAIQAETVEVIEARQQKMQNIAKNFAISENAAVFFVSPTPRVIFDLGLNTPWEELKTVFNKLKNMVKAFEKIKQQQTVIFQIEILFRNLSSLKNSTCSLSIKTAKDLLNLLIEIQTKYSSFVFQSGQDVSPAFQNTSMEILAFSYSLAVAADASYGILQNYSLYYDFFVDSFSSDPLSTIQIPVLLQQRNELLTYFSTKNSYPNIYNLDSITFNPEGEKCLDKDQGITECKMLNAYLIEERKIGLQAPINNFYQKLVAKNNIEIDKALFTTFISLDFPPELQHLHLLKIASLYAHEASHRGVSSNISFGICQSNKDTGEKGQVLSIYTRHHHWFSYAKGDSRRSKDIKYKEISQKEWNANGQLNDYLQQSQSAHFQPTIKKENSSIVLFKKDLHFPFYLALAEPHVQTSILLDTIEKHLDLLIDFKTRQMLGHMLNKIIENKKEGLTAYYSPFIESLKIEPRLIAKFERVLLAGKQSFIETMPDQAPHLLEMLFLIRQYTRALFVIRSLHPNYSYSEHTIHLIDSLFQDLTKISAVLSLNNQLKQELALTKTGLILSLPMKQWNAYQQADLFYTLSHLKSNIQINSDLEDPTFWKLCQQQFFNFQDWQKIEENSTHCSELGNAILHQIEKGINLEWEIKEGFLVSKDSPQEWTIDLQELSLKNKAGYLVQSQILLQDDPSLKRLFNNRRAEQKKLGNEIHFEDSIWGSIKLIQTNLLVIQRKIDHHWYTYIPASENQRSNLHINVALFYNHAFWFNPENPQDIFVCDLNTGKKLYSMEKGQFLDAKKKAFVSLHNENRALISLLTRFENIEQISVWTHTKLSKTILEFSRFKNSENNSLIFEWDLVSQTWIYKTNPHFSINTAPDQFFDFKVEKFLPLISQDKTKEKWLIPLSDLISKGYQPVAAFDLPLATEPINQKKTLEFFEYDLIEGKPIPASLNAKIYLTHLYLAQKNYQEALNLMSSISISEKLGELTIQLIIDLMLSAEKVKDSSPNACSIRLHAYILFKKINPFILAFNEPKIIEELLKAYQIYISGPRNIENQLLLSLENELEIINHFEVSLNNESHWKILLKKRQDFLKNKKLEITTYSTSAPDIKNIFCIYPVILCKYDFSNDQLHFYFSNFISASYLSKFEDFSRVYQEFKNALIDSIKFERSYYDLVLFASISTQGVINQRLPLLFLVATAAKMNETIPDLPHCNASNETRLKWYQEIQNLYHRLLQSDISKQDSSIFKKRLEGNNLSPNIYTSVTTKEINGSNLFEKFHSHSIDQTAFVALSRVDHEHWFEFMQQTYLEKKEAELLPPWNLTINQNTDHLDLNAIEQTNYQEAIKNQVVFYQKDCQQALINQTDKRYFKENFDYQACLAELKRQLHLTHTNEKEIKELIKQLINKPPKKFNQFVRHAAHQQAHAKPHYSLEVILRAACQKDSIQALMQMNLSLDEKEARHLRSACIHLMVEVTHQQHINRLISPLEKWISDNKKSECLEEAQDIFNEFRGYDPLKNPVPLLFEYLSGLRVKAKQAHIINFVLETILNTEQVDPGQKEELIGKVFQLIMAGGKTSVIISLLVELIAEAGQGLFCCVLSHHSQMASVTGHLKDFQSKRFNKDIYVLDYAMQDLSKVEVLDLILKRLKEANRKQCALVMKTTLPQIIELKFLADLLNLSPEPSEEDCKKIDKLREINEILLTKGVGIFDECDINLSILLDVIIPIGQPKQVKPERAALEAKIFECLVSNQAMLDTIGLMENKQANLSQKDLQEKVIPFIAHYIFDYSPLKLKYNLELKPAFVRFICNQILIEDQKLADDTKVDLKHFSIEKQENVAFLRFLKEMAESQDRYQQEGAQLISLVKKISLKVLNFSFSRSYNRGYGKDLVKNDGRIIPYLAARTPATTQFGNMYLALAYQAQAALNDQINEGEILFLSEKMIEAARHYAKKDKINFLETEEAKQFKDLTSISLADITLVEKQKEAMNFLNDPKFPTRRLKFEAELSTLHIHYYSENLTSKSINNVSKFRKNIACSGTIWNHATYHRGFGKAEIDPGTEGSILNLLSDRASKKECIYEIKDTQLESFFKVIKNHPKKEKLRALVDGGGFLKDYTNEKVAKELMLFFAKEESHGGPIIEAIIYLHKFSKQEIEQGTLEEGYMLLKKEGTSHLLTNTNISAIEKHGVNSNNLFALFDELRATGTDISLNDQALFLTTVDHKMPLRSFLQAVLRARKIFKGQEADYLLTTKGRQEMVGGGKTFDQIKDTLIKNEAMMLKDQTNSARFAQIEDVVRSAIMRELVTEKNIFNLRILIQKYREFLVSSYEDNPYQEFGRIHGQELTLVVLDRYTKHLWTRFEKTGSSQLREVKLSLEKLLEKFKAEIPLNDMLSTLAKDDFNATVELEQEKQIEITYEMTLDPEIEQELSHYAFNVSETPYLESIPPFTSLNLNESLFNQIKLSFDLQPVSTILDKTYYLGINQCSSISKQVAVTNYASCFTTSKLWATKNFLMTITQEIPIFHPKAKKSDFVLALKNESHYEFILISKGEAVYFKECLEKNKNLNIYLLDLKGMPEINGEIFEQEISQGKGLPQEFLKGLWYANLFNGNIDFLNKQKRISQQLISGKKSLMARFLQLRIGNNSQELNQFYSSSLFDVVTTLQDHQTQRHLFSWRRNRIEEKYNLVRQYGKDKVANLTPEDVKDLAEYQIQWLTHPAQIAQVPDDLLDDLAQEQIKWLDAARVPFLTEPRLIQAIQTIEQAYELNDNQLQHILGQQVSLLKDSQLEFLPSTVVLQIEEKEQIQRIKGKQVQGFQQTSQINAIDPDQLIYLTDHQIPHIQSSNLITKISPDKAYLINADFRHFITSIDLLMALPNDDKFNDKQKEDIQDYLKQLVEIKKLDENPLKPWQISYLPKEIIKDLQKPNLIRAIPPKWADQIQETQVKYLTLNECALIPFLTYPVFTFIIPDLYEFLIEQQILQLQEKDYLFIQKLPANFIQFLNNKLLQLINPAIVNNLSTTTIQKLTNPKLLLSLNENSIQKLELTQVEIIKKEFENYNLEQINKLSSHQLKFLPNCKIPLICFSENRQFAFSFLTIEQYAYLTGDQFNQLKKTLGQGHYLFREIINLLNSQTLEALEANDAYHLREEGIKKLDDRVNHGHLIQAIMDPTLFSMLNKKAFNQLTAEQVKLLSKEEWHKLENPELLIALKNVDWDKDLTDQQKDQIKLYLAKNYLSFLDLEIQGIKKFEPWQVSHLPEDAFSKLSRVELIRFVPPSFYSALTKDQASLLTDQDKIIFKSLSYPAFTGSKCYLYSHLTSMQISQLQLEDTCVILELKADKVLHLNDYSLQTISPNIVQYLDQNTIKRLISPVLLFRLSDDQLDQITDKQKEIIQKTLDENLVKSYPLTLKINSIKTSYLKFLSDQYISQVPNCKVSYLNDRQWEYLSYDQIQGALEEGVIQDTKKFISALNINALKNVKEIKNSKVNSLIASYLTEKQISLLNEIQHKNLIQSISSSQLLKKLTDQTLQYLIPSQITLLDAHDLKRLTSILLLLQIPSTRLQELTNDQKTSIKNHIPNMQADEVPTLYLNYLSDQQIKMLKDKSKIQALSITQKEQLQANQVRLFKVQELDSLFIQALKNDALDALVDPTYASLADVLSMTQIPFLTAKHDQLIKQLSSDKLSKLSNSALQAISEEQVATLQAEEINRLQKDNLLLAIPASKIAILKELNLTYFKQALANATDESLIQSHHLPFIQEQMPIFRLIENPDFLIQLDPPFFSHLSDKQLMSLRSKTLTIEQVHYVSISQVQYLNDEEIQKLTVEQLLGVKERQSPFLTKNQINSFEIFPAKLLPFLPDEKLKHLQANQSNLLQVDAKRHHHLTDHQLQALYQPRSLGIRVAQTIGLSILFLPKLIGEFIFNLFFLTTAILLGLFLSNWRSIVYEKFKETFIYAPIRTTSFFWISFDYIKYKRIQQKYERKT